MASIKNCRTCHTSVAKNAIVCPQCGRVNPSPGFIRRAVNFVFLTLALGLAAVIALSMAANL